MRIKNLAVAYFTAILCLVFVNNCFSQKNEQTRGSVEKEKLKLRNAAFCSCLRYSLPKSDSMLIKDGSSAGYFETSAYNLSAFDAIDSLAKKYGEKEYKSKYGKPLRIMKCLDFYNSKKLDSLVESLKSTLDTNKIDKR